ncbi:MAG: o-succinylbenzoate synthase, partial [Cyanobacteria bacterium P01_D01_bin.73]
NLMRSLTLKVWSYSRPFKSPLRTFHGMWADREGIIVQITDENGHQGWGEVAPLPWFGTETFGAAVGCLSQLAGVIAADDLWSIGDRLPCCQFALGSAWWMLNHERAQAFSQEENIASFLENFPAPGLKSCKVAGLLPAGAAALECWQNLHVQGHRTLKWKVTGDRQEPEIFEQLLEQLPESVSLRLDANGGLSRSQAQSWLHRCDQLTSGRVEYFEQPLSPKDLDGLRALGEEFATPIALDESVATVEQLQAVAEAGWSGIVVIKPAIAGYPQRFFAANSPSMTPDDLARQPWLEQFSGAVFSSVFETPIGQWGALQLMTALGMQDYALGFGTDAWLTPLDGARVERVA